MRILILYILDILILNYTHNYVDLDCRSSNDFPKFLGLSIETFLALCDDPESDVRIVADECLNRTIKVLNLVSIYLNFSYLSLYDLLLMISMDLKLIA